MDLVPEVHGWNANAWLRHGEAGGVSEYTCFAVGFGCIRIQLDPLDGPILDKSTGAGDRDMSQAAMQLHDR